jgi:16S rRNA (cytosine1402-N4)-methyltransferase
LRIRVNSEIEVLSEALLAAIRHSNIHARIIVISYHSLEDGETKRTFHLYSGKTRPPSDPFNIDPPVVKLVNILTKKPLVPSFEETRKNPRSRSAKFRVVERTDVPFK